MRAETGNSRPSVWDDRPRIDKAGQNRRSDGWKSDVYCQPRQATMSCTCERAVEYQKEKQRKSTVSQRKRKSHGTMQPQFCHTWVT